MIPIRYNLRSLAVRRTTTLATAFGIALVVFVMASSLMLSAGIQRTMASSGASDAAIVLRKGAGTELASSIETRQVNLILAAPGVKQEGGAGVGVGEITVVIAAEKPGTDGQVSNVQVRGVPANVLAVRPQVKVVEGRAARPGTDEVILGKSLRGRFAGMELGQSFELKKGRPVTVVGIFEAGGSAFESEVWADVETVRTSFGREGLVSSVTVKLESAGRLDAFQTAVESDKQLGLEVMREVAYYEKQSEGTSKFISAIGTLVAVFFSLGAMIGAAITMYAAVAQRRREIGTLQALGFSRGTVLASFLLESVLLALGGGLVGALASLALAGVKFSMMNFATWQEVSFSFDPNPATLGTALAFGAIMGVVGGFFPALSAARTSPLDAMRG